MLKRFFDILISALGMTILLPFVAVFLLLIWLQDFCNPFYIAPRARSKERTFKMIKLRSMIKNADKKGGASTAANDRRITWVGRLIRKTKFDEVPQLWNVLRGEMSLVGPRPQVMKDVSFYTEAEYHLFDARPGITDFASIVFADEGEILKGRKNPDLSYNQLIRPWKSRLGLFYCKHQYVWVDIKIIGLTLLTVVSRRRALVGLQQLLTNLGAPDELVLVAGRTNLLIPVPPPGSDTVETRF